MISFFPCCFYSGQFTGGIYRDWQLEGFEWKVNIWANMSAVRRVCDVTSSVECGTMFAVSSLYKRLCSRLMSLPVQGRCVFIKFLLQDWKTLDSRALKKEPSTFHGFGVTDTSVEWLWCTAVKDLALMVWNSLPFQDTASFASTE